MEPPEVDTAEVAGQPSLHVEEACPYVISCMKIAEPPARFERFMELPRELRDNVYDACLSEAKSQKFDLFAAPSTTNNDGESERPNDLSDTSGTVDLIEDVTEETQGKPARQVGLRASIEHRAPTNMSLSSKKMRQECGERSKQAMILKLKDSELYGFQEVTLPEQAQGLLWAEIHLILFCYDHPRFTHSEDKLCNAVGEVAKHRRWIEKLVTTQLSELRSFSIHAHLCYCDRRGGYRVETAAPCEAFISKTFMSLSSLPKLKELTLCKLDFHASPDLEGPKAVVLKWSSEKKDRVLRPEPKKRTKETAKKEESPSAYESKEKVAVFSA